MSYLTEAYSEPCQTETERAVSSATYYTIPGTSVEARETQENTSTQAGTNKLSAPEKKKRGR